MSRCDPLLAGLPRDPDYSVPCYCSSSPPSNSCLVANRKCDKCWGASSDKTVDYTIHWSRTPEPETLETAASENTVTSTNWRPGRDSGPQSHWSPPFSNPDSQEHCNEQDLVKRHQSITKVTPTQETPSCCTTIYCCGSQGGGCGGREIFLKNTPTVSSEPGTLPVLSRPVLKMS